jgi:hypothetical protein
MVDWAGLNFAAPPSIQIFSRIRALVARIWAALGLANDLLVRSEA